MSFFISAPNDKKSFYSIEGEWNGVMYSKLATGVSLNHRKQEKDVPSRKNETTYLSSTQENAVFIDTKKLGIIKKKVRKLEDQLEYESRRCVGLTSF